MDSARDANGRFGVDVHWNAADETWSVQVRNMAGRILRSSSACEDLPTAFEELSQTIAESMTVSGDVNVA